MDKRMLLSNLDLLATAPCGVAKLRELILTLAVQGKLVPQDPADEPASVLLQKIRAEKDRLIAQGKIKRDKALAEIGRRKSRLICRRGGSGGDWSSCRLQSLIARTQHQSSSKAAICASTQIALSREFCCLTSFALLTIQLSWSAMPAWLRSLGIWFLHAKVLLENQS